MGIHIRARRSRDKRNEPPSIIGRILFRNTAGPRFAQISEATARTLDAMDYTVNQMGVDTRLIFPEYDCSGKQKEWLRYAANWTKRRGFRVEELDVSSVDADQIEDVSEAWRKTRTVKRKEVRFLNSPHHTGRGTRCPAVLHVR